MITWFLKTHGRPKSCVLAEHGAFVQLWDIRAKGWDCFAAANDSVAVWGA